MTQRSTPSHVNSLTQVVIAAGGKGTRLVKSGYLQPKCLIELNGQTVLSRIMTLAAQQNIRKILILTGYGADQIKQYCSNSKFKDLKIEFSDEEKPLGNGGALVNALPQLDETFLFLYGDLVLDINFIRMHKFHKENDADITIFAHPGDHPLDADIITVDKQNRLKKILKYPHEFRPIPNLINSAIYMINRDSLKSLPHSKIDLSDEQIRWLNLKD